MEVQCLSAELPYLTVDRLIKREGVQMYSLPLLPQWSSATLLTHLTVNSSLSPPMKDPQPLPFILSEIP